ncbi:MAG: ribonuclease III [Deltaproteobacteria bacterium]|nr:ribonuclease III [Deltaproteobacteria bacterium]
MSLDDSQILSLERTLGYCFRDRSLLIRSLTHTSHAYEREGTKIEHYERLEFLGDAVMDLAVSVFLFDLFPQEPEGDLSKRRASLVNERQLTLLARELHLGDYLLLGKGEEQTGGRDKDSILANAFEAVIAAIYLDGGWIPALDFCRRQFEDLLSIETSSEEGYAQDFKTRLQEKAQELFKETPQYELIREEGPDHEKIFEFRVTLQGEVRGTGIGHSKKEAQQRAAEAALEKILELTTKSPVHGSTSSP